jgi:hypothetical protein
MKKSLVGLVAALATASLSTASLAFQNEPTGFRGIAWGTPLSVVQDQMVHLAFATYTRRGEVMAFHDVPLGAISYRFENGTLTSVELYAGDDPATRSMLASSFVAEFGAAGRDTGISNPHGYALWLGSKTNVYLGCDQPKICRAIFSPASNKTQPVAPTPVPNSPPPQSEERKREFQILAYRSCMTHCSNMSTYCTAVPMAQIDPYRDTSDTTTYGVCNARQSTCEAQCAVDYPH